MGESRSIYFQDDALVDKLEAAVERGEFRNLSHAVEAAVREQWDQ